MRRGQSGGQAFGSLPFRELAWILKEELAKPLPGKEFQDLMLPASRRGLPVADTLTDSAVLLALKEGEDGPSLIFIVRSEDGKAHGGQVAFPGGRAEAEDASLERTAMRESEEEIGLEGARVEIIGKMSPLVVHVSRYLIHPFVGIISGKPDLRANEVEVSSILEIPLSALFSPESRAERIVKARGEMILAPSYLAGERIIWGATAMILREFEEVLNRH
jgi:8-oxo-dGTP pyrophosphatase MutT (NUDIX family)